MVQRTAYYIERVMDALLTLLACQKGADSHAMWMPNKLLDLPRTAEESALFEDGCPTYQLTL